MSPNPKTLTNNDIEKLLTAAKNHSHRPTSNYKATRNLTMILLMLDAGLRVGEVVEFRVCWFFYDGTIMDNVTIPAFFTQTKTERSIPIGTRLKAALITMLTYVNRSGPMANLDRLFGPNMEHGTLTTRQVQRIIKRLGEKAGLGNIHPHMLRHTFGTRLMRTTNAAIVQRLLGHKHLSSTQIYCHPNAEDLKNAIDGIDPTNDKEKT